MTDTQTDRPAASGRVGLDSRDLTAPRHTVEVFVSDFMRELNYGQGVSLARSSVNDQYLALARTVRHHLPSRWMALDELPKNANGKIDRPKIRSLFEDAQTGIRHGGP